MTAERRNLAWTPELVGKLWDGIAAGRQADLSFAKLSGPKFFDLVKPWLRPSGRHLDFGAGNGHFVKILVDNSYDCAAYEPSPRRAEAIRALVGDSRHYLGALDGSEGATFDVIVMAEVIEHILPEDFEAVLRLISRLLAPGGVLIVTTPNNEDIEQSKVFCPVSELYFHPWQHVRSFTPESLVATLSQYGMTRQWLGVVDFSDNSRMLEHINMMDRNESRLMEMVRLLATTAESQRVTLQQQADMVQRQIELVQVQQQMIAEAKRSVLLSLLRRAKAGILSRLAGRHAAAQSADPLASTKELVQQASRSLTRYRPEQQASAADAMRTLQALQAELQAAMAALASASAAHGYALPPARAQAPSTPLPVDTSPSHAAAQLASIDLSAAPPDPYFDLRQGGEATIVYVAKKE